MALRIICRKFAPPSCLYSRQRLLLPLYEGIQQQHSSLHALPPCPHSQSHSYQLKQPNMLLPTFTQSQSVLEFSTGGSDVGKPEEKLGLFKRFKQMYKEYWYVLIPVHIVTSAGWLGGFYYMAVQGVDIVPMLEYFNTPETIVSPFRNSKAGYVAVTYGLYKIATPARYAVTVGGTTISIKYLRDWGYIKPVPSKERLRQMYEERKDNLKVKYGEQKETLKEKYEEKRENLKEKYQEGFGITSKG